jgi:L,D-transpeptidase ErfK/SrfK
MVPALPFDLAAEADEVTIMTRARGGRSSRIVLVMAILAAPAQAQSTATLPRTKRRVIVSILDRKLAVLDNGAVLRTFPVAVGAEASPSPTGEFAIVSRLTDPTYYHAGVVIPAGGSNPLGPRWVGLSKSGYGIHGTNAPGSIGKAVSHGCIRLRNRDIVQLFAMVEIGDTVEIRAERNDEISEVFGNTMAGPGTPAQIAGGESEGGQ